MPGTTSLTINNEDLSLTLFDQVKELRAMKDHPYPSVDHEMENKDVVDGGERIIVRWDVEDHSTPTRVQTGYESFGAFAQPTLHPGNQAWGIVVQPVFISSVDEKKNGGRAQIIKTLETRVKNVERHSRRLKALVQWRGAAASGTHPGVAGYDDFLSLNGADTALGLLEDQASGTNILHGVNKALFPSTSHEQFHNFFSDCAADASANLLPALYASTIDAQIKEGSPNPSESYWYISRLAAGHLKTQLRAQEQYTSDGAMDDGKRVAHMYYGGIKMFPIAEMPNTGSASTAKPWSVVRVNWKQGIRYRCMSEWASDWTEFMDLPGTVGVRYALMKDWGQRIALQPGCNAVIVDAEVL
jgi:hypothetical protein